MLQHEHCRAKRQKGLRLYHGMPPSQEGHYTTSVRSCSLKAVDHRVDNCLFRSCRLRTDENNSPCHGRVASAAKVIQVDGLSNLRDAILETEAVMSGAQHYKYRIPSFKTSKVVFVCSTIPKHQYQDTAISSFAQSRR